MPLTRVIAMVVGVDLGAGLAARPLSLEQAAPGTATAMRTAPRTRALTTTTT
ncbi:MAG TPA: hypothetical protein VEZ15_10045 [Acidimicrobiia bacterium]|nr:hypothetical protein [Acidimicrobiia bacterium]